ncbi:MAG TPA: c-type cytochrome [Thermoanaerobaculia bacterium]|nr:c-type cytochrome [Thermoanaerobaculia bacterium]
MKRLAILLLAVTALAQDKPADKPVEETKTNIKVLQGLPTSQLIPVMAVMSNSLGVTCAHCHTAEWSADEKPAKEVARRMLVMTRGLNAQHFEGKPVVSCNTCHNGHVKPNAIPLVAASGWNQIVPVKRELALPSAADVLASYTRALGGAEAIAKVTGRTSRGIATRMNGRTEPVSGPFTMTQDRPLKVSVDTQLSYPPEANREVGGQFFRMTMLPEIYPSMKVVDVASVRGRDAYVVEAQPKEGRAERLYFDVQNGLLLRRAHETQTPYGILPEEYDFDDWRDAGNGIRAPYLMTWSRADYRVTHKFDEITFR